jgi:zinc transport system substrate-binding protein
LVRYLARTHLRFWVLPAALCVVLCCGCGAPPAPVGNGVTEVVVPIAPVGWMMGRVGGSAVRVSVLVPPGQSAETWQVLPRQMEDLGRARLYGFLGLPFEAPLVEKLKAMFPDLVIADLRQGLTLRTGEEHHDEGGAEHAHGAADPHVWLDPVLLKTMAATAEAALVRIAPGRASPFAANRQALSLELDTLHAKMGELLGPVKGREFFVFHPAFGYLADRYGLKQTAVEVEGKAPGARRLSELAEKIKNDGARALFIQPQYSTAEAKALAESAGLPLVTLDDLAGDYPENLLRIAHALVEHLR